MASLLFHLRLSSGMALVVLPLQAGGGRRANENNAETAAR